MRSLITPYHPVLTSESSYVLSVNQRNVCRNIKCRNKRNPSDHYLSPQPCTKPKCLRSCKLSLELLLSWAKTLPPGFRKLVLINAFDSVREF